MKQETAIVILCLLAGHVHAQMHKCVQDGRVVYQQAACADARSATGMAGGTVSGIDAISEKEIRRAQQLERAEQRQAQRSSPAPASERPTDQDIKNLETSARSITISKKERQFLQAEVERARAAQRDGSYTAEDLQRLKEAQADQNRIDAKDRERARIRAEGTHLRAGSKSVKEEILVDRQIEADRVNARRAAAARQAPAALTNCDGAGCWDTSGHRYNRAAGDGNFFRSDGKACQTVGNQVQCN